MQTATPPRYVSNYQLLTLSSLVCLLPPLLLTRRLTQVSLGVDKKKEKKRKDQVLLASPLISLLSSADGQPTLLPPEQVQQLNLRSTAMLNNVQRLFSHHMIQTFGCDYSTSGVTLETLQTKLRNFLELCTEDGPRHDTYLIFYSGHTHKGTGSWALAGERPTHFAFTFL